jgi:hypothetical protein
VTIRTAVALNSDRANVCQKHNRALPDFSVETSSRKFFANNCVGLAKKVETLFVDGTDDANAEAWPRKRLALNNLVWQSEFGTDGANLIFEQGAKRLD